MKSTVKFDTLIFSSVNTNLRIDIMATFNNTQWDANETGDALYEKLFKKSTKEKKHKLKKKIKKSKGIMHELKTEYDKSLQKRKEHEENIKLIESPAYREKIFKIHNKQFVKKHKKLENGDQSTGSVKINKKSKRKKKLKSNTEDEKKKLKHDKEKKDLNKSEHFHSDINDERDKKVKLMLELLKQKVANEKLATKSSNISTSEKYKEQESSTHIDIKPHMTKKNKQWTNNDSLTENLLNSHKNIPLKVKKKQQFLEKLKKSLEDVEKVKKPVLTLRQKMMEKLRAARFRFLNEQIYTTNSKEAQKIFQSDPEAFKAYHEGYRQQVNRWPMNPLDYVIKSIRKMPKFYLVADFGCGEAKLARSVEQNVYSFDLVAVNETVIACDMTKVPLEDNSVDVAVFCLSLMGTNLNDYIVEANRILKVGGTLKIAEVESRFEDVDNFVKGLQQFGFRNVWRDLSHNLFYFLDFTKVTSVKSKKKLPMLNLLPCLYKKR